MKIAVVGAGAMGSVLGACLAIGGGEVWFVDPYAAHMNAIAESGLSFDFNGTAHSLTQIHAVTDAAAVGKVDLILLMVKGIYTQNAVENIRLLSTDETVILSLQNGLGNIDLLRESGFGENQLAHGIVDFAATLKAPGQVLCQIKPGHALHFSPVGEQSLPALTMATEYWQKAGLAVELLADASFKIWYKLANNCSFNAVCALVRTNMTGFLDHPLGKQLSLDIIREIVSVANAKGIPLMMEPYEQARAKTLGDLGRHVPSTSQDMMAKKPTEVEFLYGAVCREGAKLGIPTPCNALIYSLTKIYEDTYDSPYK